MNFKNLKDWQKTKILACFVPIVVIGVVFLTYAVSSLYMDKAAEAYYWDKTFVTPQETLDALPATSKDALEVTVGTYVETLKEINIKSSYFRTVMLAWFVWEGNEELSMLDHFRVYQGNINSKEVVADTYVDGTRYQLIRMDVTVTKNFWTKRFPMGSHQLRIYLESTLPTNKILFKADKEGSGINQNLSIAGYTVRQNDTGIYYMKYASNHSDPALKNSPTLITAEHVTAIEVNRSGVGLYVKCFVALVGTMFWVLVTLYLNTYHRIDPLSMIPATLFGTVANIMVGANLLPDALELGLLEYVNFWGIMMIIAVTVSVITINRIRSKYEDLDFAHQFGKLMFFTVLTFVIVGNLVMPLTAYYWKK